MNCNNCVLGCIWTGDKYKPRYYCIAYNSFMNKHELTKNRLCDKYFPSLDKVADI